MKKEKPAKWNKRKQAQKNVNNITVNCCWLSPRVDKLVAIYTFFFFPQHPQGLVWMIYDEMLWQKSIDMFYMVDNKK